MPSVFISYARQSSTREARALREALGTLAFQDTEDIAYGDRFPERIANSLLDASVVVVFADLMYFTRWFCLRELRLALSPSTFDHIVVARGNGFDLSMLPPRVATVNWPSSDDTGAIVDLVRSLVDRGSGSVRSKVSGAARNLLQLVLEESSVPPPLPLPVDIPQSRDIPPSLEDRFVGRADELAQIHFNLFTLHNSPAAITGRITAAGGFGKTRLAAEYLRRFGPNCYPGGLFWVNFNTPAESVDLQLHDILKALNNEALDLESIQKLDMSIGQLVRDALSRVAEPTLVVLDDIPEPSKGEKPLSISAIFPPVGRTTILATSRHDPREPFVTTLELDVLNRDSSVALLTYDLDIPASITADDLRAICGWVGDLPLALDLLNYLLSMGAVSAQNLLHRAEGRSDPHNIDADLKALEGQVPDGAIRGIAETFALSLSALGESGRHAAMTYAFFAHAPVPHELISKMTLGHLRRPENKVLLKSHHIVSASSVEFLGPMHPVLATYLSRQYGASPTVIFIAQALKKILIPASFDNPEGRELAILSVPHAEALFDRLVRGDPPELELLADRLGDLGPLASLTYSAVHKFERAEELARTALRFHDSCRAGHSFLFSGVSLTVTLADELLAKSALVQALIGQQRHEEAYHILEGCLALAKKLPASDDTALHIELGMVETSFAGGDVNAAGRFIDRLQAIGRDEQLINKLLRARAFELRSEILTALGRIRDALTSSEEFVECCRGWYGERHLITLGALSLYSLLFSYLGDFQRAMEVNDRCLMICANLQGKTHIGYFILLGNSAHILVTAGRVSEASERCSEALEGEIALLGNDHPTVAITLCTKADILINSGQVSASFEPINKAIEILRARHGADHPHTLKAMQHLCFALYKSEQLIAAESLCGEVYSRRQKKLGKRHPDTVRIACLLAQIKIAGHDFEAAQRLLRESLAFSQISFGPTHPQTVQIATLLSGVVKGQKWWSTTRAWLSRRLR